MEFYHIKLYVFYLIIICIIQTFYNDNKEQLKVSEDTNNYLPILPKIKFENDTLINYNLTKLFYSRELFINNNSLTESYIHFIRPINLEFNKTNKSILSENEINSLSNNFINHEINFYNFTKLCVEEKLINFSNFTTNYTPQISVILPSFNKENILMKSIRSIQNQSFKNIEIIIVDDCSSDNSKYIINIY